MQDDNQFANGGDPGTSKDASAHRGVSTVLYQVQPGDDLCSIAVQFYGRPDFWAFIFIANPGEIHGIRDLPPGKLLRVPMLPVSTSPPVAASGFLGAGS